MSSGLTLAASLARGQLIGTFIGLILYGVTCLQAFFYFQTYVDDRRGLKLTVALLLALETVHAALTMRLMDDYLIVHYADETVLESATWFSSATYIIGFSIDFMVYLYFTWRIGSFTENICIVVLMSSIATSRTAISILACVLSVKSTSWMSFLEHMKPLIITGNVLFVVGDMLCASAMAYYLNKRRSGMYRTDLLINRLLIFAMGTGALTLLVDIVALILVSPIIIRQNHFRTQQLCSRR
ncbi:hypothetical protein F5I97DRAFT_1912037 [Phlebopus sp. FC_14]|nr:hypothetical protein F5I97DRAFT_1912037 [Phlebopus sp. FC_14]